MTGVHQDTICRLAVRVGQGCSQLLDEKMRNLQCNYLEFDEIWGFIGKKEKHRRHGALKCTPAMAAGVERIFWTVGDFG